MNLEERMAFRREMLYEAIKVTMLGHGILSASYRFRVVRDDRRGHRYSVLVDLSADFMHKREGSAEPLAVLGAAIQSNAARRYGVMVSGVYWRVNDKIQGFETDRPEPAQRAAGPAAPGQLPACGKRVRATAEEFAAFEADWPKGQELKLGDRVYASDLAPLG